MWHEKKPPGFDPLFSASGVFVELPSGEILLLKRVKGSKQEETWSLPGGLQEARESAKEAAIRETQEETKIPILDSNLHKEKTVFINHTGYDFIFNIYKTKLSKKPQVELSHEHSGFIWVPPTTAILMNLIADLDKSIASTYLKK